MSGRTRISAVMATMRSVWLGSHRTDPAATSREADRLLLVGLVVVAGCAGFVLAVGHLAALVFDHRWPSYRAADAPGVVARVVTGLGDPGRAWDPVNRGGRPPGPLGWWATALVTAVGLTAAAVGLARRRRPTASAAWATGSQLRRLHVHGDRHGRLVVGTAHRRKVAVEQRHSLLVLGPTQTGKTTGLAVPAILEWPGPVVATSVKGDLVSDTIGHRSRLGDVHVFDPAACTPYVRAGWTPLAGCDTWAGAVHAAWELTKAAQAAVGNTMALADFWFTAGAKSLAPLLLAARASGRTIADVARWVDREDRDEPLAILRTLEPDAVVAHEATFRREDRARSSLIQVMQSAVGPYLDPVVAASATRADIVAAELLDGTPSTLYITAPADEQDRLRPLFTAVLSQVLAEVYRTAGRAGKPLDSPLLLVLDEAANIAPVDNLPTIAATAAAMGLQVITIFQDLAQIRLRYRDAAGTVVNNHRAKLLLPAVSDLDTLDLASRLIGEEEIDRDSATTDDTGRRSSTTSTQWRRLLPPESACRLRDGDAVLLYGNLPPTRVRLRPWYADRTLKRRAAQPFAPLPPSEATRTPAPAAASSPPAPAPDGAVVSIEDAARARRRNRGGAPA
jgi:type IV secretion system protein VirD4